MFVACATIEDSAGIAKVSICTELHEEAGLDIAADADPLKLCCHASPPRPLVDAIFKVAATKSPPAKFTCNGVEYTLIQYSANKYELIYNDYRVKQAKAIRNLSKRRINLKDSEAEEKMRACNAASPYFAICRQSHLARFPRRML